MYVCSIFYFDNITIPENLCNLRNTFKAGFSFIVGLGFGTTTYLQSGDKQEIILDRMEIEAQKDPVLNFSKPSLSVGSIM